MYNALESLQAFEAGTAGRKAREKETAMKGIGNALASGDLTGATSQAFALDPAYGMQIDQYATGKNALATRQKIGGLMASGDRQAGASMAYGAGEFELGANIEAQIAQMTQQQRETALFISGQLGNAAMTLKGITDPAQRQAEWQQMQGYLTNDLGIDPAALAQFNPMDDNDLTQAMGQAQSFSDRLAGQRWQQTFDQSEDQYADTVAFRDRSQTFSEMDANRRFGLMEDELDAKTAAAGTPGTRQLAPDEVVAAGYPEGAVVQRDAKGKDTVVYKPPGEYSAGQINKYTNDAAQLEAYDATLNEYLALVEQVGLKKVYSPDDPDVAKLEAMQQSLSFGAKNLFQLGVLSKDDYEAINRIIPDATGFEALFKNKESFMASAQPLQDYIERSTNAIPEQFRNQQAGQTDAPPDAPATAAAGNLPFVNNPASYEAVPPGGYYVGPDGQTRQKPHFLPIGGK